jgi:hypothetical protein
MKKLLILLLCSGCAFHAISQKSGKNKLVPHEDSICFHLGFGAQVNVPFYTLKTFDTNGNRADDITVSGASFLVTGRAAFALNLHEFMQVSLVTYPSVGGSVVFDHSGIRLAFDLPLLAEVFFGERGKGWGGFVGGGITTSGITAMPGEYPSAVSSDVFTFSPNLFGWQVDAGLQLNDALIRLSFSKGFDKPFGNNFTHVSSLTKNYGLMTGVSVIYQFPDWRNGLSGN